MFYTFIIIICVVTPKLSRSGVCLESPENSFGPEKPVVKLQSACFEKLVFKHVFNVRKTKRIVKLGGLQPWCCKGIKADIGPKCFWSFDKQAPDPFC